MRGDLMFDRCQHQRRNHRKAKGHCDYGEGINHLWRRRSRATWKRNGCASACFNAGGGDCLAAALRAERARAQPSTVLLCSKTR